MLSSSIEIYIYSIYSNIVVKKKNKPEGFISTIYLKSYSKASATLITTPKITTTFFIATGIKLNNEYIIKKISTTISLFDSCTIYILYFRCIVTTFFFIFFIFCSAYRNNLWLIHSSVAQLMSKDNFSYFYLSLLT